MTIKVRKSNSLQLKTGEKNILLTPFTPYFIVSKARPSRESHDIKKIRVAVLYGGRSSEHEVSLRSAAHVMQHLDTEQFDIVPIKINKQGAWLLGDIRFLETETNLSNVLPAVIDEQSQTQFDVISL